MSFFPRSFINNDSASFTPLFRLLDDFDSYRAINPDTSNGQHPRRTSTMKNFTPRFDVKEVGEKYELHGELPGIEQKDVEIEFTDDQTLTIKGRTERSYTSGAPPAGFLEGSAARGAITDSNESNGHNKPHKATVEDEDAEMTTAGTEVAKEVTKKEPKDEPKYWVSERSVGEFSRSFSFPVRVDQDQISASMKNGILSIVVPKAKVAGSRKINIA